MSTLTRLKISGIRSVSSDKPVEITFFKPLTLITGPNGSGKTTIIESIRYACTEKFPPNTNSGHYFIRDPSFSVTNSTKATVELELATPNGTVNITRKVVATNRDKLKFETLKNDEKTVIEINGKRMTNEDLLDQIVETSDKMFDYVLLCHQEMALWPFDEGKALKEKFDDIFGTSNYTKLIEDITKLHKEYQNRQKDSKLEFASVENDYEHFKSLEKRTEKMNERIQENQQQIEQIESEIEKIEEELEQCTTKQQDMAKINESMITMKNQIKMKKEEIKRLNIQPKHDYDEYTQLIEALKQQQESLNNGNVTQQEIDRLKRKIEQLKEQSQKISKEEGIFTKSRKDREELENEINNHIDGDGNIMEKLQDKYEMLKNEKDKLDQQITEWNNKLNEMKHELAALENKQKMLKENEQETMNDIQEEQQDILEKKQTIEEEKIQMQKIEDEIQEYEQQMNTLSSQMISRDFENEENQIKMQLENVKEEINEVTKQISKSIEQSKQQQQIEVIKNEINTIEKRQKEIEEEISTYTNEEISIQSVENEIKSMKNELQQMEEQKKKIVKELNEKQYRKSQLEKELTKSVKSLQEYTNEMNSLGNKENNLERIEELKKGENKYFALANELMEKAMNEGVCEICGNKHIDKNEVHQKQQKIQSKMNFGIKEKNELNQLERNEKKRDQLQEKIDELNKKQIEYQQEEQSVSERIELLTNQQTQIEDQIQLNEISLKEKQTILELLKEYTKIDNDKSMKLNKLSSFGPIDTIKSFDELNKEKQQIEQQQTLLQNQRDEIINSKIEQNKKQSKLNEYRTSIGYKKNEYQRIEEQIQSQTKSIVRSTKSIELYQQKLDQIQSEINEIQNEIDGYQEKYETINQQISSQIAENKNQIENIDEVIVQINAWKNQLNQMKTFEEIDQLIQQNTIQKRTIETQIEQYTNEYDQKLQASSNLINALRDIKIQLQEYEKEQHVLTLQGDIEAIQDMLNTDKYVNYTNNNAKLTKTMNELTSQRTKKNEELGRIKGSIETIKGNLKEDKKRMKELNPEGTLEQRYDELAIEQLVQNDIVNDLNDYKTAVSNAMMKYHAAKMKEINATIDDLWNRIYSSRDIQTIKIVADECLASNKRTTYKYRVVMIKDGVEMDMRGRCSMGQKALGSIIIRIALAKTFCSKCPILALDEPTINLDEANCDSLANHLSVLLQDDGKLSNFQILLITHDEGFIKKLSNFNDSFYRVERNDENCSCVKKMSMANLV